MMQREIAWWTAVVLFSSTAFAQAPVVPVVPAPVALQPVVGVPSSVPVVNPPPTVAGGAPLSAPPPIGAAPTAPAATTLTPPPSTIYKSIFFPQGEMGKIYSAAQTYRSNQVKNPVTADMLAKAQGALAQVQQKPTSIDHPQFYLAFIGYNDEKNWAVWMNKYKYTTANPKIAEIEVLSVNQTNARFAWRPKAFSVYESRPSQGKRSGKIKVVKEDGRIEFTLYPNQTFSSYTMTIEEGFLPPVRVEQFNTSPAAANGAPAKPEEPAPTPPLPAPR